MLEIRQTRQGSDSHVRDRGVGECQEFERREGGNFLAGFVIHLRGVESKLAQSGQAFELIQSIFCDRAAVGIDFRDPVRTLAECRQLLQCQIGDFQRTQTLKSGNDFIRTHRNRCRGGGGGGQLWQRLSRECGCGGCLLAG